MNPGLTEEGAKIATSFMDAMKTQPATLAMIVISFGLLGYTFYEGSAYNSGRQEMLKIFLEQQREVQQLLAKCVVPEKQNLWRRHQLPRATVPIGDQLPINPGG